jgi:hypothetical protein
MGVIGPIPGGGMKRPTGSRGLIRRLLPGPVSSRVVRGLIVLPGIALLCVGIGSTPTETGKMWHDLSLEFFLLAVTLPLWRRGERTFVNSPPWYEVLRRILRRTSGILLFGAVGGLAAFRWYTAHGQPSAAHDASTIGVSALLLALVPLLLGPVLRRCAPAGLRRADRVARLAEELNSSVRLTRTQQRWAAASPQLRAKAERQLSIGFDPGQGASGRPEPFREHLRGLSGTADKVVTLPSRPAGYHAAEVAWDGTQIVVTDCDSGQIYLFPVVGGQVRDIDQVSDKQRSAVARRPAVAEIVTFDPRFLIRTSGANLVVGRAAGSDSGRPCRLHLLDADGYCLLTVDNFNCNRSDTIKLAKAAGVGCTYYTVDCTPENVNKIRRLMFPRRRGHRSVRG